MAFFDRILKRGKENTNPVNNNQWFVDALNSVFGGITQSGQTVNQRTVISIAAVKKCVDIISNGVVNLNIKVYSEKNGIKMPEPTHEVSILMDSPNEFQTKSQWMEWMVSSQVLKGNGYSRIIRDNKFNPIALIPLNTEYVTPILENGKLKYRVIFNSTTEIIEAYDIIHFKGKCLESPILGYSPIVYHKETFGLSLASTSAQNSTFKNGVLKFLLKLTGSISDDQKKDLKTSFQNIINNQSSIAVVPGGVGVDRVEMTPAEAQYIESRKFSAEEIANIFGVPVSMVVSGVNGKTTVEQEYQEFYANTLANYAIKNEEELKRKLITKKSDIGVYYFKYNFNSLLRADAASRAEFYNKGINNGWMSPNDARRLEDQNIFEGGDIYMVNANLIPVDQMKEWIDGKVNQLNNSKQVNNNPNGNN